MLGVGQAGRSGKENGGPADKKPQVRGTHQGLPATPEVTNLKSAPSYIKHVISKGHVT